MSNTITIVSSAPSINGIATETSVYRVDIARMGDDGPTGYVVTNKDTGVFEYVARRFGEAVQAMDSYQRELDSLVPAAAEAVPEQNVIPFGVPTQH